MANRRRGEVDIAGRTLVMNTNALCELEDALGMGVPKIAEMMADPAGLRLSTIRTIVTIGLRQRAPETTEAQAGEIIDEAGGVRAAVQVIGDAFRAAFPETPESAGDQSAARPPLAGTA